MYPTLGYYAHKTSYVEHHKYGMLHVTAANIKMEEISLASAM